MAAAQTQTVVMKFGGTSLSTSELRNAAVNRVSEMIARGAQVVVVASAMGRCPQPYATDTLLGLVSQKDASANLDLLMACGEMISAAVLAELLEQHGIPARALTGGQAGIITDANHGDARILTANVSALRALLESGITPVVCGFQGISEEGSLTTLGRGGSDLTAVVLAKVLGNAELEIYTDVDGVMTADPKHVASATTIPHLTFEEVTELAERGANVVHDKAADFARLGKQNFSVRNLTSGAGTTINGESSASEHPVTAVTASTGYTFMHVVPEAAVLPGGWEQDAFRRLADAGISLDCVNVNSAGLFFIVRDKDYKKAQACLESLPVAVRVRRGCAKISAVGAGMKGTPGVMYRAVRALGGAGVPIIHSTDSNITISLLVPAELASMAENALHAEFSLASKESAV